MITCIEKNCKKKPTTSFNAPQDEYCHHTHYSIGHLDSIEDIKTIFPEGKADDINWFFASTSGVHGTYITLDEIEESWDSKESLRDLTVTVVLPRMVRIIYGEIEIQNKEEIVWLRKLIKSTLKEIEKSQQDNVSKI